jgi:formate hydrogenlyase subunit 4
VLDHSGPAFGMIQYAAALKLFAFGALLVRLAVPLASEHAWLNWPVFLCGTLLVAAVIGVVESTMARLKLVNIPTLLVAACLLSAFGLVLIAR